MGPSNPVLQMAVQIPPTGTGSFIGVSPGIKIRISAKVDAITKVDVWRRCVPLLNYFGHLLLSLVLASTPAVDG